MSRTTNSTPLATLRNPQQVLDALPSLLGFRPTESVCLLWLADGFVRLIQRVDIPSGEVERSFENWAADVVWSARHAQAKAVLVVWISEGAVKRKLVGGLLRELRTARIEVADCITSDGATYFTSSTTGSRRWGYSGSIHWGLGGRESLGYGPHENATCQPFIGPLGSDVADSVIASLMCSPGSMVSGEPPNGPQILRALADQGCRDGLLWWVTEEERIRSQVKQRLGALLPDVVQGFGADVAAVLAIAHWLDGDGVRAGMAIERGTQDDAHHRLVTLVGIALTEGMPPHMWREAMSGLNYETCRSGAVRVEHVEQSV